MIKIMSNIKLIYKFVSGEFTSSGAAILISVYRIPIQDTPITGMHIPL